jgi:DNA-binding NarL/FixJ family response regulator
VPQSDVYPLPAARPGQYLTLRIPGAGQPAPAARAAGASEALTAQEAQVARPARGGLSNPEMGARLFVSARTVKYHLHKVFTKLGISSRGQLYRVLPEDLDTIRPS